MYHVRPEGFDRPREAPWSMAGCRAPNPRFRYESNCNAIAFARGVFMRGLHDSDIDACSFDGRCNRNQCRPGIEQVCARAAFWVSRAIYVNHTHPLQPINNVPPPSGGKRLALQASASDDRKRLVASIARMVFARKKRVQIPVFPLARKRTPSVRR